MNTMTILLYITISLILFGFYKWATKNYDYFTKKGVKYMKVTGILGKIGKCFLKRITVDELYIEMYNAFPDEKLYGTFGYIKPFYFIRDPELVIHLTIKEFDHFEDRRPVINEEIDDIFGNSLPMLCGNKWRDMRATLSPAFTGSKMRHMFELVRNCAIEMSENLKQKSINSSSDNKLIQTEMKELFSRYTNDVIATTAFGIHVNSFENEKNDFIINGNNIFNFLRPKAMVKLILSQTFPKLLNIFGLQLFDSDVRQFFKSMVMETISVRNREQIYRPDLINLLMNIKNPDHNLNSEIDGGDIINEENRNDGFAIVEESIIGKTHQVKRNWNDNELIAQCLLFFLNAFDTNSTVLAFTTYLLAINQDCQEKLYQEILITSKYLKNNQLTYDELQKMKYMDQVISGSLRMWPPAMFIDRICVKDYQYIDEKYNFIFEKGISITIPIFAYHNDPNFFPNPTKFDPERFNDQNKHMIQSGTYIPFGSGPRNCIGSRFALMVIKAIIYYLMLNFKFEPNEKTQIPIRLRPQLPNPVTEKGIHVSFTLRIPEEN